MMKLLKRKIRIFLDYLFQPMSVEQKEWYKNNNTIYNNSKKKGFR